MNNEDNKLQLQTTYEVVPRPDNKRFIKMRLRVCHSGVNRNGSSFTLEGFEKARGSIVNIPILANVVFDENDDPQFGGHDVHLEPTEDGARPIYEEVPIGVIPETCNYAIEEYKGRTYVCVDGYVWRGYSNYAEDIIEREDDVPLSMEVNITAGKYDHKYGVYNVEDFTYTGITFLGGEPAMINAGATKETYADKKSFFAKMQEELAKDLDEEKKEDDTVAENIKEPEIKEEPKTAEEDYSHTEPEAEPETKGDFQEHEAEDPKAQFTLMSTITKGITEGLSEYTMDLEDGYTIEKYWLQDIDFEKQLAYAYSFADGNVYSVGYAVEGDNISLRPTFKKQVLAYRDFVEGQDTEFAASKPDIAAMSAPYKKLKDEYAVAQKELEELRTFQTNTIAAQKQIEIEAVLAEFEDLKGNEEFEALKEKAGEFEPEALQKECFAIRGKQVPSQFSYNKSKFTGAARQQLPFIPEGPSTGKTKVEELIARYLHK